MKSPLIILLLLLFFHSCKWNINSESDSFRIKTEQQKIVEEVDGDYHGILPYPGGVGIRTTLILRKDSTFIFRTENLEDRNIKMVDEGIYSREGDIIIITLKGGEKKYFEADNGKIHCLNNKRQRVDVSRWSQYTLVRR
ncbi:MAG: copper resistance protein NlpE N-terminal domain-containing protein [Bacteroidales bacterium]|nr:copper resistance protein NlpE N-terminal domain-containing protein [Bacteroidales bacterium]